tara:strand:- start:15172 stop:15825 length:654 start_codon:yes stop_codon:yes gene_type:complete
MIMHMDEHNTTAAVQLYLQQLSTDSNPDRVVRALIERTVDRMQLLCGSMLFRSYPRLTRPPTNLQTDELLSSVVERMLKAMRQIHPQNPRQFFGLASKHLRWELNELARRLDQHAGLVYPLSEQALCASPQTTAVVSPNALRIFGAIDELPDDEREVFDFVKIQGLTHTEAAELIGVTTKTIQRRLNRALLNLSATLSDLDPDQIPQGEMSVESPSR